MMHKTQTLALGLLLSPSLGALHGSVGRALKSRALGLNLIHRNNGQSHVFFDTHSRLARGPAPPTAARHYVPIHDGRNLVCEDPDGTCAAVLLSEEQAATYADPGTGSITACLGAAEGKSFWLLELSQLRDAPAPERMGAPAGSAWGLLRNAESPRLGALERLRDEDDGALLASARGLALWHRSVRFCTSCGGATEPARAGAMRRCADPACGERFRPRLDASVIVLVTRGERCLLGRKASWPAGRFSTLAGFVEFGETLEECVVREVEEESGVAVRRESLRFVASQPWLFPRSLMVGFLVEASSDSEAVRVQEEELQDVKWVDRAVVAAHFAAVDEGGEAESSSFHVPSRVSLAHHILRQWVAEDRSRSAKG